MNQKQLQYFVTVYQTQNIKTAADRLFVSRQGVSKVILAYTPFDGHYKRMVK